MNARTFFIRTLLAASLSSFTNADAQQQPANPQAQQPRPVQPLGTKAHEFFLSKITVSDLTKSYEFYTKVVGLKWANPPGKDYSKPPTASDPAVDFREIPLNFTGSLADPIFVLVKQRDMQPAPEFAKMIIVGFKVPSAKEAVTRAVAAGATAVGRAPDDGPMTFGTVTDPDGYHVEFIQAPSNPVK